MNILLKELTPQIKDLTFELLTDPELNPHGKQRKIPSDGFALAADLLDLILIMKNPDSSVDYNFVGHVLQEVRDNLIPYPKYISIINSIIDNWNKLN